MCPLPRITNPETAYLLKARQQLDNSYLVKSVLPDFDVLRNVSAAYSSSIPLIAGLVKVFSEEQLQKKLTSSGLNDSNENQAISILLDMHLESMQIEIVEFFLRISCFPGTFGIQTSSRILCCQYAAQYANYLGERGLLISVTDVRRMVPECLRPLLLHRLGIEERERINERYRVYYVDLIHRSRTFLYHTPNQEWLIRLNSEADNILAMLTCSGLEMPNLLSCLWRWWTVQRPVQEGIQLARKALTISIPDKDFINSAYMFLMLGVLEYRAGNQNIAIEFLQRAAGCAGRAKRLDIIMDCLLHIGIVYRDREDSSLACIYVERSLKIAVYLRDLWAEAAARNALGLLAWKIGNLEEAREHLSHAGQIFQRLNDTNQAGRVLGNLGLVAEAQNNFTLAESAFRKSLCFARQTNDPVLISLCIHNLAGAFCHLGKLEEAERFYCDSLSRMRKAGYFNSIPLAVFNIGFVAFQKGNLDRAVLLCVASNALRQQCASSWPHHIEVEHEETMNQLKQRTAPNTFKRLERRGNKMSLKEVLNFLLY